MSSKEERAELRRQTWTGGVASSFTEMERIDRAFWLSMTPADRLRMMWSLVEDGLAMKGSDGSPPRLQRSVGGVRPLRVVVDDLVIPVIHLDDLIANKLAAGRPQDLVDAAALELIRRDTRTE